jgi:hypothetical protein
VVDAEWLVAEVNVDGARERVGHHQRRAGEEVLLHVGVYATFKVAVPRQHGHDGKVVLVHGIGDPVEQRAGVANACRAAESGEVEAEFVEWHHKVGAL